MASSGAQRRVSNHGAADVVPLAPAADPSRRVAARHSSGWGGARCSSSKPI